MQYNQNSAMERLAQLGMDDMPVVEYTPIQSKLPTDWFTTYRKLIHELIDVIFVDELIVLDEAHKNLCGYYMMNEGIA